MLAGNDPTSWTCVLGLWRAGLAWVPVNPRNSVEANIGTLEGFDCEVLFFQAAFEPMIEQLQGGAAEDQALDLRRGAVAGCPSLDEWIDGHSDEPPVVDYEPDDVVAVMPTGGTTGKSKGVMNTHRSFQTFCANFMITCSYRADEPIVNLAAAPMTHTAGVLSLPCTARGGTVVVLTRPEPAALLDVIERHGVTELFLPPTVIYRLLDEPGRRRPRPLVAALLHLRRGAAVGRQAAARDRRLRSGDDAGLRPDRGAGGDRDAAPRGVPRRRRAGRRRAAVRVRPAEPAGARRDPRRGRRGRCRRARPARSASPATW